MSDNTNLNELCKELTISFIEILDEPTRVQIDECAEQIHAVLDKWPTAIANQAVQLAAVRTLCKWAKENKDKGGQP